MTTEGSKAAIDHPMPRPRIALAVAAVATLLYFAAELYMLDGRLGFPLDDSWIHLQFARHLAEGNGLSYDGLRPMPGSTAPLWTALLSLGFVAGAGTAPLVWAKLSGVLCFLASLVATDRLAAELGLSPGGRRLATVLVASSHWLVWSALSGMEILLFTTLALWGLVFEQRERRSMACSDGSPEHFPYSLPLFALAALARPEGYLLLALSMGWRLLDVRETEEGPTLDLRPIDRRSALGFAAAALLIVPNLLFTYWASGSFLPTTFAVKAGGIIDPIPDGAYLRAVLDVLARSQPVLLLLAAAGIFRLAARLGRPGAPSLLPALWPVGQIAVYSLLADPGGPVIVGNFGRYYFPLLPLVVIFGVLGAEELGHRLGARTQILGWNAPLRAMLVALLLAPNLWGLLHGPGRYVQTLGNVEDSDVRAALWLGEHLDPEATLAVQDIGAIAYHLPNPIVDLTGIVEPSILPTLRGDVAPEVYWEERLLAYLAERRPDYLVIFTRSYPMITHTAQSETGGFRIVRRFQVSDNVTMAGDELAIVATPWTRYPLPEETATN